MTGVFVCTTAPVVAIDYHGTDRLDDFISPRWLFAVLVMRAWRLPVHVERQGPVTALLAPAWLYELTLYVLSRPRYGEANDAAWVGRMAAYYAGALDPQAVDALYAVGGAAAVFDLAAALYDARPRAWPVRLWRWVRTRFARP